ncbi:MAG: tRNA lysidine(34) synthetase TilS [Gemmatimonadaceae bacterium]|nr:tRNA lysidine(34) synthetase TilS [Gemmatimonadaceae bacterium]
MPSQSEAVSAVQGALAALPSGRWLLAVSGGRDSMVLLDAMASARGHEVAAVATFDHGTGRAATRAASLVERRGLELELPVVSGTVDAPEPPGEASWRHLRWRFLRGWAEELDATILTAHTADDQVETVVQRILRGAGARGLAGMNAVVVAPGLPTVLRPLLGVAGTVIADYATTRSLRYVTDPTNRDRKYQRNRVRHDILPALERAAPGFGAWCADLSVRAAAWRTALASLVDSGIGPTITGDGALVLWASRVQALGADEWSVIWPELAARVGVVMDRRGIARASAWAPRSKPGGEVQLSRGATIRRTARTFVIRASATLANYIDAQ